MALMQYLGGSIGLYPLGNRNLTPERVMHQDRPKGQPALTPAEWAAMRPLPPPTNARPQNGTPATGTPAPSHSYAPGWAMEMARARAAGAQAQPTPAPTGGPAPAALGMPAQAPAGPQTLPPDPKAQALTDLIGQVLGGMGGQAGQQAPMQLPQMPGAGQRQAQLPGRIAGTSGGEDYLGQLLRQVM